MHKISISGPAELLAVLPFHFGFRPSRSVVVVCFHDRRMGLVARLDVCPRSDADDVAAQVLPAVRAEAPSSVVLVGYEEIPGEAAALSDVLVQVLEDDGIEVSDRLLVRDGRWYGMQCDCCPGDGTPLTPDADVPGVAGFVALGRAVLPDREALSALVEPSRDDLPGVRDAIHEFVGEIEWARRLATDPPGSAFFPPGQLPPDDTELRRLTDEALTSWAGLLAGDGATAASRPDLPALAGCLRDLAIRDGLIAWLCPGTLPVGAFDPALVEALEQHLGEFDGSTRPGGDRPIGPRATTISPEDVTERLEALCRAVPPEHAAPVLAVTAAHAWWRGDGARASVALEVALELEPDHRLCALLRRLVGLGIRTDRATA